MPHIKNALIRYRIIDRMLRNKYKTFPSKADLREACEEALYGESYGDNICDSTIEKDMFAMKMDHDAPIKYSKSNAGYYYLILVSMIFLYLKMNLVQFVLQSKPYSNLGKCHFFKNSEMP